MLAHYTGWPLSEIDDMPTDDLVEWVETLPKPPSR